MDNIPNSTPETPKDNVINTPAEVPVEVRNDDVTTTTDINPNMNAMESIKSQNPDAEVTAGNPEDKFSEIEQSTDINPNMNAMKSIKSQDPDPDVVTSIPMNAVESIKSQDPKADVTATPEALSAWETLKRDFWNSDPGQKLAELMKKSSSPETPVV